MDVVATLNTSIITSNKLKIKSPPDMLFLYWFDSSIHLIKFNFTKNHYKEKMSCVLLLLGKNRLWVPSWDVYKMNYRRCRANWQPRITTWDKAMRYGATWRPRQRSTSSRSNRLDRYVILHLSLITCSLLVLTSVSYNHREILDVHHCRCCSKFDRFSTRFMTRFSAMMLCCFCSSKKSMVSVYVCSYLC